MGNLTELTHLRLSFNALVGTVPTELGQLKKLELVQLHGNRISGVVPRDLKLVKVCHRMRRLPPSSLIVAYLQTLMIHLNAKSALCVVTLLEIATRQKSLDLNNLKRKDLIATQNSYGCFCYSNLAAFVLLSLLHIYMISHHLCLNVKDTRCSSVIKITHLETIGEDSVYRFYMTNKKRAWGVAVAVMAVQIAALVMFVNAAVKDFSNEQSDFKYSWKCPRNSTECTNESDLDWRGWTLFAILMAAHLLKDILSMA